MDSFSQMLQGAETELSSLGFAAIVPRMLSAVAIGTVLALRPWRLPMHRPLPKLEMIQAQILLCAASAVIVAVIGNSLAKAFGLVGLGGFVRFKSGLKDPRDAAVLYVIIGLGMACGHGSLELAFVGGALVSGLLVVLDYFGVAASAQRIKVTASADDVPGAEAAFRNAFSARNVLVRGCVMDLANRRMELEVEERTPGAVAAALASVKGPPVRELAWEALAPPKEKREDRT